MSRGRVVITAESDAGHRKDYLEFLQRLFAASGISSVCRGLRFGDIAERDPILSTMFEEHPFRLLLIAALRACWGRRTATLLFRGVEAAEGQGMRLKSKRFALRLAKRLPRVTILSIVPSYLHPGLASVTSDWIYDLQFWDRTLEELPLDGAVMRMVREKGGGRLLIACLGRQDREKGLGELVDIVRATPALSDRIAIVSAGRIDLALASVQADLARFGAVVIDRFISDDELLQVYAAADVIWACYAPIYDQSSGIFGRALQFGKRVLVREGSAIQHIAIALRAPAVAIPWGDHRRAADILNEIADGSLGAEAFDAASIRGESVAKLASALGLDLKALPR